MSDSLARQLKKAVSAAVERGESMHEIAVQAGVPHPVLYRLMNGVRENVRLDIASRLTDYLGLELVPKRAKLGRKT